MKKLIILLLLIFSGVSCAVSFDKQPEGFTAPYDGKQFSNLKPTPRKGYFTLMKWRFTRVKPVWPESVPVNVRPAPQERLSGGDIGLTFVGHSTFLIRTSGLVILTDPIWSDRASPVTWAGPKRVQAPGVPLESLPQIDVIIVSHNHYDHMDLPTLEKLAIAHPEAVVLTGLGNAEKLRDVGFKTVHELDWWEKIPVKGVPFTFVPAQHFSARTYWDRNETLWGGVVIHSSAGNILFAGDTGEGPHFGMMRERLGAMRLSLLPIGAYNPQWFMAPVHLNPAEAVDAHTTLESRNSVGMHFGTFQMSDDLYTQPVEDLQKALKEKVVAPETFTTMQAGDTALFR